MKNRLLHIATAVALFCLPQVISAQAPTLGTASDFVLFSSIGALTNTGSSQLTGNVGTNGGSSTTFGNVNGGMHNNDGASAAASSDLLTAYNQLNATVHTATHAPLLGNGETLNAGVYAISGVTTLTKTLTLNGQNNANAVFIFQINGTLSSTDSTKIVLINGALACNVFWKVEGLVSMATATSMKGTIIANNAAISLNTGVSLEGRALSTGGAISINNTLAYLPTGCGSVILTGPASPDMLSTTCYALFSANGGVTNSGVSVIKGDIGTNIGLTTGFDALKVTGAIHPIADGSTAACAADLLTVYNNLNTLPADIELMFPAQFGRNLVLTPHTYVLNGATVLTDSLYLNAAGNTNAVFVMQIKGAFSTSTYAKIFLTNGTQAKNVFWVVNGAVDLNDYADIKGTIICNNGALNLKTGINLDGKALTTNGAVFSSAVTITSTTNCIATAALSPKTVELISISPNPMKSSFVITIADATEANSSQFAIYNVLGKLMLSRTITEKTTTINTYFPSGIYIYKLVAKDNSIQTGKLISK